MVRHQVIKSPKDLQVLEELVNWEKLNRSKRFEQKLADQEYKEELNTLFDPVIKPINTSLEQRNKLLALTENQSKALEFQNTLLGQTNKALEDQNILTREQNALTQDLIDKDSSETQWSPSPKLQKIVKLMSKQTNPQLELQFFDANKNEFLINKQPIKFTNDSILTDSGEYRLTDGFVRFLTNNDVAWDDLNDETLSEIKSFLRDINYSFKKGDKKSSRYKLIKALQNWSTNKISPAQASLDTTLYESADETEADLDQTIGGEGLTTSSFARQASPLYVFLSSDPDFLLDRLEVLIAESSVGNNNVLNEILAIGEELHRQGEVTDEEYQNFLTNFGEV